MFAKIIHSYNVKLLITTPFLVDLHMYQSVMIKPLIEVTWKGQPDDNPFFNGPTYHKGKLILLTEERKPDCE